VRSVPTVWLGYLSLLLICAGAATAAVYGLLAPGGAAREWLRRYERGLANDLGFLHLRLSARAIASLQAASTGALLALACGTGSWWPVLLVPPVLILPRFWLRRNHHRRTARIEEQLDKWLLVLANALKASASLGEAMACSASHMRAPLWQEIEMVLKEFRLGTSLDQALQNMNSRIGSRSLAGALLVMRVARNTGGDLPSILESSAAALREMARLEGVARTKTAEGKLQTMVIAAIPFALVGMLQGMDPAFFLPLAQTFSGHLLVAGAAVFWLAAIAAARKILAVDI
jgi:tight adherence protein B